MHFGLMDASAGMSFQVTGDDTVYDLEGVSSYAGFSFGAGPSLGFDLVYSGADFTNNFENVQAPSGVQVTIGVGVGIDVHFRQSYTVTTFQYR